MSWAYESSEMKLRKGYAIAQLATLSFASELSQRNLSPSFYNFQR